MSTKTNSETTVATHYWHDLGDGRLQCDLCPRFCKLHDGQRGLCFVRQNQDQQIVLTSYGRSSGFAIDPIEKKPLNHFYPGSSVFSFGTAGCNLACKFCQNWDISKSQQMDSMMSIAGPEMIAQKAAELDCLSVAYTYNDPVIFHEYAIDTAIACRELGIKSVAVSAGYVCPEPRAEFYQYMDAANIDLKAFTERFYRKITGSHLAAVLDTLCYLQHETSVWLELTTLIIQGENDSPAELEQMTQWVVEHLGPDVPMHFTAFHPDWKMLDTPATPVAALLLARDIALKNGVHYAYVGNVHHKQAESTYCHHCGQLLIGRDWYQLSNWNLTATGACTACGTQCAGHFAQQPGVWGAKCMSVNM
ncbi:MAG: AmmeMemoRadiSam system radical SAM enzyme [Methyloprofundus sp.]|nr:AmmeMemoRadiSam system radical SAM enzyme [Methyloprofundus sp.]MDT8424495.1 AmmeMemoRadiSam system radical SAM enzyme [Methyloprofundus sp.]